MTPTRFSDEVEVTLLAVKSKYDAVLNVAPP